MRSSLDGDVATCMASQRKKGFSARLSLRRIIYSSPILGRRRSSNTTSSTSKTQWNYGTYDQYQRPFLWHLLCYIQVVGIYILYIVRAVLDLSVTKLCKKDKDNVLYNSKIILYNMMFSFSQMIPYTVIFNGIS